MMSTNDVPSPRGAAKSAAKLCNQLFVKLQNPARAAMCKMGSVGEALKNRMPCNCHWPRDAGKVENCQAGLWQQKVAPSQCSNENTGTTSGVAMSAFGTKYSASLPPGATRKLQGHMTQAEPGRCFKHKYQVVPPTRLTINWCRKSQAAPIHALPTTESLKHAPWTAAAAIRRSPWHTAARSALGEYHGGDEPPRTMPFKLMLAVEGSHRKALRLRVAFRPRCASHPRSCAVSSPRSCAGQGASLGLLRGPGD